MGCVELTRVLLLSLVTLVGLTSSLKCFLCQYKTNNCPSGDAQPQVWSNTTAKYNDVGLDKNYFCVVSTTKGGEITFQVRKVITNFWRIKKTPKFWTKVVLSE